MSKIDTGGSAFPRSESLYPDGRVSDYGHVGMTLRDYFAAKAMQGWIATYSENIGCDLAVQGVDAVSQFAYAVADAMLKARQS